MRVLKWIVDRARLRVGGQETPFGWVPKAGDLDLRASTSRTSRSTRRRTSTSTSGRRELESQGEFFNKLERTLPAPLQLQREILIARLAS